MALALLIGLLPLAARAQDTGRETDEQQRFSPLTVEAEQLWSSGKYKKARKLFERVEQLSLSSRERAHAILAQGDCYMKAGDEWKAFQRYQKAVDNYSSFIPYNRVLEIEYEIAERHFAGKKGSFLFISFSTRDKAREIYDHITAAAPYSEIAPKAAYRTAVMAYEDKDYELAIQKYTDMIATYSRHELAAESRVDLARCLVEYAKLADGDGLLINRANIEIDRFLELYPNHPRVEEARELQAMSKDIEAARLVKLGEFYQRSAHERLPASVRYLNAAMDPTYSGTPSQDRAKDLLDRAEGKLTVKQEKEAAAAAKEAAATVVPDAQPPATDVEAPVTPDAAIPAAPGPETTPDVPRPADGGADTATPVTPEAPATTEPIRPNPDSGKYLLPVTED